MVGTWCRVYYKQAATAWNVFLWMHDQRYGRHRVPVNLLAATIYYEATVRRGTVLFADLSSRFVPATTNAFCQCELHRRFLTSPRPFFNRSFRRWNIFLCYHDAIRIENETATMWWNIKLFDWEETNCKTIRFDEIQRLSNYSNKSLIC